MIDLEKSAAQLREALSLQEAACKYGRLNEDFETLVAKLQRKGYSKEYAEKVAGKVAKEKGDVPYQKKRESRGRSR